MSEKTHLYILWTNADLITSEKMVFMYATNALIHGWWEKVTVIVWGATAQLVSENKDIQKKVKGAQDHGVYLTACKACSDQLGVSDSLKNLGIEVKFLGIALTNLLKGNGNLLTV